jgi:hypothetical protein
VISGDQTRALPLLSREYSSLALLTTGVKLGGSSLTDGNTPREGAFNVNGLRSVFNNFLIDGVDNNAYGTSNQGFSNQVMQPAPDAIGEFKVVTNNMSAEYGPRRRGDDQRQLPQRHQRLPWQPAGSSTERQAERDRLLQAGQRQAGDRPQPVRRRARRPDRQEQGVLLRRLRRAAADAQGDGDFEHRHAGAAAGRLRGRHPRPAHRHRSIRPARRFR